MGGGPLQELRTPNPPKVLGKVPAKNRVLREVLAKVLWLASVQRTGKTSTFGEHLPKHQVACRHLPEHLLCTSEV